MKLSSILLTILAILAFTSAAYAGQEGAGQEPALEVAAAVSEAAEAPACSDDPLSAVVTDPLGDVRPQSHDCGDGHHVDSCAECPQFSCFCSQFRLCCYC